MPGLGERRIPVSVRDDTVSAGRPAAGYGAVAVLRGALMVSFPLLVSRFGLRGGGRPGSLQHEPPLAAARPPGTAGPVTGRERRVLLCADAERRCRGPGVRRAGVPLVRDRAAAGVGLRAGADHPGARRRARRLRPRRGRCRSCGATHILLPSWSAPRRADAVGVIARAAAASVLHGTGTARLGAETGRPGGDRAGLAAPPPGTSRPAAAGGHGRVSAASSPSSRPPRAVTPARRGRPGPGWTTRWPSSPRARCAAVRSARPGRGGPGGAGRPVRPRRRPHARARQLIPGPVSGIPMPGTGRRRSPLAPGAIHLGHRRNRAV